MSRKRRGRARRMWRYNSRIGKWVLIECREGRRPPCRILKVSSRRVVKRG